VRSGMVLTLGMIHTLVDFRSSCDDWGILLGGGNGCDFKKKEKIDSEGWLGLKNLVLGGAEFLGGEGMG